VPASQYRGKTDIGLYGDFINQIDATVGEVLACLDEQGLAENTLVVFTSDNGASPAVDLGGLRALGHDANYPWRGNKADLYEGGHRTPFVARWPDVVPAGKTCDQTICTTDFFATIAGVLGCPLPDDAAEDSYNILPLLRGEEPDGNLREATIHHSVSGHFAIRRGKWKLLEARGSGGWSFPKEQEAAEWNLPEYQLYDMERDRGERTNLVHAFPDVVSEMRELLDRYRNSARSAPRV